MNRFLDLIVAGEITAKTKEALLKQLDEQAPLVVPAISSTRRDGNMAMPGQPMDSMDPLDQQRPLRQRQQVARADANITDPVTKIVGLILGSPEFQRQ
jgi:hypothetical protein